MMDGLLVAVVVFALGLVLWIAIKIARAVQRAVDAEKIRAATGEKKQSRYHWVWGSIHWIWLVVIPAAKYVYREWKTAPANSAEKFFWTMVFALTAAIILWIAVRILDRVVNRDKKPADAPENALIR